jgi:hypothetical protein
MANILMPLVVLTTGKSYQHAENGRGGGWDEH